MSTVRPATADDGPFLERMLVAAADWRPGSPPRTIEQVLSDPALAHYVVGWPGPGEFGVIAEDDDGTRLGAAWCRYLAPDDPGYGFVAAQIPELSIGVVAEARGQGLGRSLMNRLIDDARTHGVGQLSLSVELDNVALHLYASLGFTTVAEADGAATMVLDVG